MLSKVNRETGVCSLHTCSWIAMHPPTAPLSPCLWHRKVLIQQNIIPEIQNILLPFPQPLPLFIYNTPPPSSSYHLSPIERGKPTEQLIYGTRLSLLRERRETYSQHFKPFSSPSFPPSFLHLNPWISLSSSTLLSPVPLHPCVVILLCIPLKHIALCRELETTAVSWSHDDTMNSTAC